MRTAAWEPSAGALAGFLNATTQVHMADLWTFTAPSGAVVARWTSADTAVVVAGQTYAVGPAIKRGRTKIEVGIAVDTLDVTLAADASVQINGTPLLAFIAAGGFDNCRLALERAFASAPGAAWVGTLALFSGRVSDTKVSRYEATLSIASDAELLNAMVPRNVYQPGCSNTLFDGTCGLSKAAYAATATATTASDAGRTTFSASGLPGPTGYYELGFLKRTVPSGSVSGYWALGWAVGLTGANAGVSRTIKSFSTGSVVRTIQPWPLAVAVGDTFTVYPGCDKALATCTAKFSNAARFRGQPFVPPPETVL